MSLLDELTGGETSKAQGDLDNILAQIQGISTPTAAQLQLGPLAQYYNTGDLNAATTTGAQAGPSAYDNENLSSVPMSTMQQALGQEAEIANAQGMTPQERASIAEAEDAMDTATAGQRGAIAQNFAGMGVPQSLISAALQNGTAGQEAQQGYLNALQAQGQAADQGITALQNEGALAGQMYSQQAGQANTVAAAQNALNQFNAANTQQANLANQANQQAANTYNTQNAQNVGNQNVQGQQEVQYQNQVNAPQTAAQLALEKGNELAGIGEAQANQATGAGQQQASLLGGLIGEAGTMGASALAKQPIVNIGTAAATGAPIAAARGGEIEPPNIPPTAFLRGGSVPGQVQVPGDSEANDIVPAKLSPGEFVVPRSAMARPEIRNFLARNVPTPRPPSAHPSDIASIMKALSMLRAGGVA